MGKRSVAVLAGAIVIMLLLTLLSSPDPAPQSGPLGVAVLPDIRGHLGDVEALHIKSPDATVSLLRQADQWQVAQRWGYSADRGQVVQLLRDLADMNFVEQKTSSPQYLPNLGLAATDAAEGAATAMEIKAGKHTWALLIGNEPAERAGQYLRLAGQNQAWLVDKSLAVSAAPAAWLAPVILNVDAELITAVTLSQPGAAEVNISSVSDNAGEIQNARVTNLPSGATLKYPGVADEPTRALVNLRLQDVQPFANLDWQGAASAQFDLTADRTLLIRVVEVESGYWLAVSLGSEFTPADRLSLGLHEDIEDWAYKLSPYHYQQFTRSLADFLAEPDQPVEG
jgi:hypothetical protein